MDSQRFTRKVRTCEKDLAKAKENLEKWELSKCAAGGNDAKLRGDTIHTIVPFPNGESSPPKELLNMGTSGDASKGGGKAVVVSKSGKGKYVPLCCFALS